MFPFQRILFPVDYSAPCLAVVPYVKEIIRHFNADLTLVHAYGGEALAYTRLPLTDPEVANEAQAFEEQRLRDFAQDTFPGEHIDSFAEVGEAGSVIHKLVQRQGTDLIMLATRGNGPIRRLLLGSVTAKVLHDVSAAVWTGIGSNLVEHPVQIPYKSVLCALDDSDEAEVVLKAAAAFACSYHAALSLVQVIEMPPVTSEIDFIPYRDDVIAAADVRLRELKATLGVNAPHAIMDLRVADCVRDEAIRRKADLIITGRGRAQGAISRMWSHLYAIVRESPCPVLSI